MARLAHIWCHPIKGIGCMPLEMADLSPAGALHGDRAFALRTQAAPETEGWQHCRNFLRAASGPSLAAITAKPDGPLLHLSHPDRPDLIFDPTETPEALAPWVAPIWPESRPAPAKLVRAGTQPMTDAKEPLVSLGNLASLRALSEQAGQDLDMRRFRLNFWIDGLAPWAETTWPAGATLTLGNLRLKVDSPIERCRATEANPETGHRDANTLRHLGDIGQDTNFGIFLWVETAGTLHQGDTLTPP